jgi:hypothetical protein
VVYVDFVPPVTEVLDKAGLDLVPRVATLDASRHQVKGVKSHGALMQSHRSIVPPVVTTGLLKSVPVASHDLTMSLLPKDKDDAVIFGHSLASFS